MRPTVRRKWKQERDERVASMPELARLRIANLQSLINQRGAARVAEKLGLANTSYLGHMTSGRRPITEKQARKIEECFQLPQGWMSHEAWMLPGQTGDAVVPPLPVSVDLLAESIAVVQATAPELNATKCAEIVTLVYIDALKAGRIDRVFLRRLVKLAGGVTVMLQSWKGSNSGKP